MSGLLDILVKNKHLRNMTSFLFLVYLCTTLVLACVCDGGCHSCGLTLWHIPLYVITSVITLMVNQVHSWMLRITRQVHFTDWLSGKKPHNCVEPSDIQTGWWIEFPVVKDSTVPQSVASLIIFSPLYQISPPCCQDSWVIFPIVAYSEEVSTHEPHEWWASGTAASRTCRHTLWKLA